MLSDLQSQFDDVFSARLLSERALRPRCPSLRRSGVPDGKAKRGHLAPAGGHHPSKPHRRRQARAAAHSPSYPCLESERRVTETHPCSLVSQCGCTALRTRSWPQRWCSLYITKWLRYPTLITSAVPALLWFILAVCGVCTQPKPLSNSSLPLPLGVHTVHTSPLRSASPFSHRPLVSK